MRIRAALLCLLIAASPALAQDKSKAKKAAPPPPKMTEKQKLLELKKSCSKEAEELKLKSDARKSFLAGCLNEPLPPVEVKADTKADAKADPKSKK